MEQKIEELNEKEHEWIAAQVAAASHFVAEFSSLDTNQALTLAVLDRAFAKWMGSNPSDASQVNETINCVGVAFGTFLVDGIGMKWVIATDEYGSDLAVYALPGQGDVLVYPANFVAKRWKRRETNFLEDSYLNIKRDVEALTKQWATRS